MDGRRWDGIWREVFLEELALVLEFGMGSRRLGIWTECVMDEEPGFYEEQAWGYGAAGTRKISRTRKRGPEHDVEGRKVNSYKAVSLRRHRRCF
jgi:hypothetical protein